MDCGPYRKALQAAIASICQEAGYEIIDKMAMETVTEAAQSFMVELGRSSKALCEHAGRTEPTHMDIVMALIQMGRSVEDCMTMLIRKKNPPSLPMGPPTQANPVRPPTILQAGEKRPHPTHIPSHLPPFPDPHAYIRSPTHKQPVTEYEAIREKSATQKRDVERALTRFMAKTRPTHSLFEGQDNSQFLLIECKPTANPYLSALLPKDQNFDEDDSGFDRRKRSKTKRSEEDESEEERLNESQDQIDNPFLRPVKMPRKKKR